jgi:hypothetical protein
MRKAVLIIIGVFFFLYGCGFDFSPPLDESTLEGLKPDKAIARYDYTSSGINQADSVELEMCLAFDSETETYILSLAEYNGRLYAGTASTGKIYVYDGTSWDTAYDSPEWHVNSLAVYDEKLYAGTWNSGRIYSYDGENWTLEFNLMDAVGLPYPEYEAHVFALAAYNGKLYAGADVMTDPYPTGPGGLIYVYDGFNWTLAYDTDEAQVRSLAVYEGKLYAGTGWTGKIYVYDGTSWDLAYDSPTHSVYSFAIYKGNLYAGTSGTLTAGDIYGFDGSEWTQAFDSPEAGVFSLATYKNSFYAGTFVNGRIYGPCILIVDIDIKPGSLPNSINLGEHGLLPVSVLGSGSFDVTIIDPDTIELGGVDVASRGSTKSPKLAYSYEDVNVDGYMDLMAFWEVQVLVDVGALVETTTELTLTAYLSYGKPIEGTDSVNIVP